MKNEFLNSLSFVLVAIGGLNWGFYGIFEWDVIASVFGQMSLVTRLIDVAIGIAGVYQVAMSIESTRTRKSDS